MAFEALDLSDKLLEIDLALYQRGHAEGDMRNPVISPELLIYCAKQIALQNNKDGNNFSVLWRILFIATGLSCQEFDECKAYSEHENFPYELVHWGLLRSRLNDEFILKMHQDLDLCTKPPC